MFNDILLQCQESYVKIKCCHEHYTSCDCYNCKPNGLENMFYNPSQLTSGDGYYCEKKMLYYVISYGDTYVNEFYNYLSVSKLLNRFKGSLKVLSLGCGFCPDYYAMLKYIGEENLDTQLLYNGIDNSYSWDKTRIMSLPNLTYQVFDLTDSTKSIQFHEFDIITINKIFSTLYGLNKHEYFLESIKNAVENTMKSSAALIFGDVNNKEMGRDVFDQTISPYFNNIRRFYTAGYTGNNWIKLSDMHTKTVFFEYRK